MQIVLPLTDEPIIAAGLRSLIGGSDSILLEPLSFDTENLGERLREARPNVVLISWNGDLSLPALGRLCGNPPLCPTILLARNPSPELVYQAQEAGFSGVLDARSSRDEILSTLERCESADSVFDYPPGMDLRPARAVRMSARQGQIVRLLAHGLKNKEIATSLGLTEGTVKQYLCKLFKKSGAKDRFELALFGLKNMVSVGDDANTRSAAASASPNGGNHGPGLRTLVMSEFTAHDNLPYRAVVFEYESERNSHSHGIAHDKRTDRAGARGGATLRS
jgi:DNA-binding NarL/FixJ family response regulator